MYDYEYYPQDVSPPFRVPEQLTSYAQIQFPFPEELATGLFPYVHK